MQFPWRRKEKVWNIQDPVSGPPGGITIPRVQTVTIGAGEVRPNLTDVNQDPTFTVSEYRFDKLRLKQAEAANKTPRMPAPERRKYYKGFWSARQKFQKTVGEFLPYVYYVHNRSRTLALLKRFDGLVIVGESRMDPGDQYYYGPLGQAVALTHLKKYLLANTELMRCAGNEPFVKGFSQKEIEGILSVTSTLEGKGNWPKGYEVRLTRGN